MFFPMFGAKMGFYSEFLELGAAINFGPSFWFAGQCGGKEMTIRLLIASKRHVDTSIQLMQES